MDNGKYKPTRFNKGLREIAEQLGYTPGEFSLMRFAQDAKTLKEWVSFVDAGTVPPELGNLNVREARELVRKEVADLLERERNWLPFFYPTMRATEVVGTVDHEHNHRHTHEPVSETSGWIADVLGETAEGPAKEPRSH